MYLIKNIYISQQLESPEIFYWIPVWTLTHVDSALFLSRMNYFFTAEIYKLDMKITNQTKKDQKIKNHYGYILQ